MSPLFVIPLVTTLSIVAVSVIVAVLELISPLFDMFPLFVMPLLLIFIAVKLSALIAVDANDAIVAEVEFNVEMVAFNGKKIKKQLKPCGNFEFQDFRNNANEIVRGTWGECFELIRSDLLQNV